MAKLSEHIEQIFNRIVVNNRYVYVLLGILCVIVYANSLDVPFYFDDYAYIAQNPFIRTLGGIFDKELIARTPLYEDIKNCVISRPLSFLTFSINYAIHQTSVAGYHVVNIVIHLINACLIQHFIVRAYALYLKETADAGSSPDALAIINKIAFFTAAIFAVHPVMTNAVTYVLQRMAPLATLFYLLTMVLYVSFRLSGSRFSRAILYLLAIISSVAAMKSKEIAFTLPVMLAMFDSIYCRSTLRARFQRLVPFLLCVAVVIVLGGGGIGTGTLPSHNSEKPSMLQVVSLAKASPIKYLTTQFYTNPNSTSIESMSPLEYFFTQCRVVITYQRMLLLPVGLNFVHDYPFYRSLAEPAVLLSLGFHLLILTSAFILFRLSGTHTGENVFMLRLVGFGVIWFYLSLAMECGIIPMDDHILEHRMYLPAFGFIVALVSSVYLLVSKIKAIALPASIFFFMVILIFSTITILRNEQWRDPLVFWQDALAKSPNKHRIHGYIGNVYRDRGNMPDALQEYRLMLANDFRYGQDHFGLGEMLLENGKYHEAVEEYLTALKIRPDKIFVYRRLAEAYKQLGEERLAAEAIRMAGAGSEPAGNNQGVW